MANTPAIRTGSLSAVTEFIFRPGGTAVGNVFTQWDLCHSAASSYSGASVIRVDSSLANAVVGTGAWDMSGVTLSGFEHVAQTGPADVLELSEGATLLNLERMNGPFVLRATGSSPAISVTSFTSIVADTGVRMEASGSGPLVSVADGATFFLTMLGGSQLVNSGVAPILAEGPGGSIVFQLLSGAQVSFNTVTGNAALVSVNLFSSGSSFSDNQVGLTATPVINRIARAERVFYDNVSSGLVAENVQDAIDEIAAGSVSSTATLGQRTYGNVFVVWSGASAPLTVPNLISIYGVKRGNIDLLQNTPSYAGCSWRMEFINSTPPTVFDNLTFTTTQEIVDWVNANVPQSGGFFTQSVQVAAYDVVDPQVDPLFKVMGKNRTFSRFRAADRYWSPNGETVRNGLADFLSGLWLELWGSPVPTGNPPGSWVDEFRLFWTPQNHRRLYLLPSRQFSIDLNQNGTAGNRQMIQVSDDTLQSASVESWTVDPSREPVYGSLDSSASGLSYYSMQDGFKLLPQDIIGGNSVIIGYPMVDSSGNRSVYVKPVGIDMFHTNWFDDSLYQLEAVGSFERDGQYRIRPLSPENPGQVSLNSGGLYPISQFVVPLSFPNTGTQKGSGYQPGEVRFQLRDLTTNRVSPLANPKIAWDFRKRYRPLAAIVRNDATR